MGTQPTNPVKEEATAKKTIVSPKIIVIIAFLLIVAGFVAYQQVQSAKLKAIYQEAISAKEAGDYVTAVNLFTEIKDYKDSQSMILECYDAESLEHLQTMYRAIDAICQMDNKLASTVSTVISNVDTINSAGTLLSPRTSWAISELYSGGSYRAYARCSAYDLAKITAYFPSAQVSKGTLGYETYVPIFNTETAKAFVDGIESANTSMKDLEEAINDVNLSDTYQDIQEQLLLTYDALKDYHSFVANEPTDYKDYDATVAQKKTAVSDLLKNLPSTVKSDK